jgi:hypothetical protein
VLEFCKLLKAKFTIFKRIVITVRIGNIKNETSYKNKERTNFYKLSEMNQKKQIEKQRYYNKGIRILVRKKC